LRNLESDLARDCRYVYLVVIIFHWPDHGLVQPGTHLDIASDGGHVDTCEVEAKEMWLSLVTT
jgi:hypothetical protein